MRDKSQPPQIEHGLYRHYGNGHVYRVTDVELSKGDRAPDDEWLVRYQDEPLKYLAGIALKYSRPYQEFVETVPNPKNPEESVPRFEKIEDK
jgi:hypothetical protein